MTAQRVKPAAGMLPDTAPLIPMKAHRPKHLCQHQLPCRWHFEERLLSSSLPRQRMLHSAFYWTQQGCLADITGGYDMCPRFQTRQQRYPV